MRARAVLVPIALLAGALLAWRRRRAQPGPAPLAAPPPRIEPVALPEGPPGFVSIPWTLVASPPDRPELRLRYACTEQMELDRVDARETPSQVFVTVLMHRRSTAGGGPAAEQEHETVVALSGPLGSRALVHAPVDVAVPGDEPGAPPLYP
jgi:hypothetical protein